MLKELTRLSGSFVKGKGGDYYKQKDGIKVKQKGRESLNSTAKHKVDVAGQQSYKEENT